MSTALPPPPKRPTTAQQIYINDVDVRQRYKEEHPNTGVRDMKKDLSAQWMTLTPEAKAPYEKMQADQKAEYERQLAEYKQKYGDDAPQRYTAQQRAKKGASDTESKGAAPDGDQEIDQMEAPFPQHHANAVAVIEAIRKSLKSDKVIPLTQRPAFTTYAVMSILLNAPCDPIPDEHAMSTSAESAFSTLEQRYAEMDDAQKKFFSELALVCRIPETD